MNAIWWLWSQRHAGRLRWVLHLTLLVACLSLSIPCKADMVFPARLEITEVEPGIFEVFFVLPVVQGKVLKAQPVLPSGCVPLTKPVITGDYNAKISKWQVTCLPDSLYGQKFGIEGLLGSQVDILFSLKMLNGRSYQRMLSPVNAFFLVPYPPRTLSLVKNAIFDGLRTILNHGALYLLMLMVAITKSFNQRTSSTSDISPAPVALVYQPKPWQRLTLPVALAVICFAAGQQLTAAQWLLIPDNLPSTAALLLSAILSLQFLYHQAPALRVNWLLPALLGLAFGSVDYNRDLVAGYTSAEALFASIIFYLGVGLGIIIIFWLSINFLYCINLIFKADNNIKTAQWLAYAVGILSCALLFYEFTPYFFTSGPRWTVPLLSLVFILVVSIWMARTEPGHPLIAAFTLLLLLGTGMVMGIKGIRFDWEISLMLMVLLVFIIYLWFKATPPRWVNLLFIGSGTIMCGLYMTNLAAENLSYARAQTVGFLVVLMLLFILGYYLYSQAGRPLVQSQIFRLVLISLSLVVMGVFWTQEFSQSPLSHFISDYTAGILHIPVASLLLLLLAVVFWPRYKAIHRSMGLKRRAPITSILLAGLAFFLLPWLTLKATNPVSEKGIPDMDRAGVIVQQVLSNTYHAFNLQDENQLYNQLSQSVDQDLIEDIYLDSRRKLRAGVRQGAEVLVKEVELLEIKRSPGETGEDLLRFDTRWVVTARVRHLQHIHHRKNQYTGTIVLKTEDTGWKISGITLTSEDRTVIANTSG